MTYRIVSLPINSISKIPQSSNYTKKFQVAAFLPCLSARELDMMELLNALASTEGRGIRALKVFLIHHKLPVFPLQHPPCRATLP